MFPTTTISACSTENRSVISSIQRTLCTLGIRRGTCCTSLTTDPLKKSIAYLRHSPHLEEHQWPAVRACLSRGSGATDGTSARTDPPDPLGDPLVYLRLDPAQGSARRNSKTLPRLRISRLAGVHGQSAKVCIDLPRRLHTSSTA